MRCAISRVYSARANGPAQQLSVLNLHFKDVRVAVIPCAKPHVPVEKENVQAKPRIAGNSTPTISETSSKRLCRIAATIPAGP